MSAALQRGGSDVNYLNSPLTRTGYNYPQTNIQFELAKWNTFLVHISAIYLSSYLLSYDNTPE